MLAWPLRVGRNGRLARADDPWEPLLEIIRAMAASQRARSFAPWFGLAEVFGEVKRNVEDQPGVAGALNEALKQLGVDGWARIDAVLLDVEAARSRPYDPPRFSIRFATPHGLVHRSLSL